MVKITANGVNEAMILADELVKDSGTMKAQLEATGGDEVVISDASVNKQTLPLIIEYLVHHKGVYPQVSEVDKYRTDNIEPWDKEFTERVCKDMPLFFSLTMAANYLDIKPLLDLCCKTVANMIKGHSPEEIKEKFKLPPAQEPETATA